MKNLESWLSEYAQNHQNRTNQKIHRLCVPAIVFSILGMLWPLKLGPVNGAMILTLALMPFYISLGLTALTLILPQIGVAFLGLFLLEKNFPLNPLFLFNLGLFVLSWIGQLVGHQMEGKKPSFFKNLQFLLIGPLWIFKSKKRSNE